MMPEEWQCSTLRLCQLATGPDTAPSNHWNAEEVLINTQKCPAVDYDHSSVFRTLKAYTYTLYEAWGGRTNSNKQHRSQKILEPEHSQTDIVDHYAEMLCADILDMAMRRIQSPEDGMACHPEKTDNSQSEEIKLTMSNQEKHAERLASDIYSRALDEIAMHNGLTGIRLDELSHVILPRQVDRVGSISEVRSEALAFLCSSTCQPVMNVDTMGDRDRTHGQGRPDYDPGFSDQTSGPATCYNKLNGMTPSMTPTGSLDYPDAPPSTPLLPGMMKSRGSFCRKLKGGLAKEFLPSPPPPTPKDQQAGSLPGDRRADTATNGSEFMIRLMRSLSLACAQCGDVDEEEQGAKDGGSFPTENAVLSDYADRLSADIVHCITSTQTCVSVKEEPPVRDVHVLADHLAEEIILMSVADVLWSNGLVGKTEQNCLASYAEERTPETEDRAQASSNALVPSSSPDVTSVEILTALSGKVVANALAHAFSDLGVGALQYSSSHQFFGAESESMGQAAGSNQCPNSNLDITKRQRITALDLGTWESEPDYIADDTRAVTLTAGLSFAEGIVDEALRCFLRERYKCHSSNQTISDHLRLSASVLAPRTRERTVVKGIISETQCREAQELQIILLWAAASHMGASALRLPLPDGHIQQQLCSLSLRTQLHGWTVGDLMGSVLQFCEDPQTASRGRCKSSGSLLGHLLLCVD